MTADNTETTWSFSLKTELRACGCAATISRHWNTRRCLGIHLSDDSIVDEPNSKRLGIMIPTNFVTSSGDTVRTLTSAARMMDRRLAGLEDIISD
jgi:hypothetical protein